MYNDNENSDKILQTLNVYEKSCIKMCIYIGVEITWIRVIIIVTIGYKITTTNSKTYRFLKN